MESLMHPRYAGRRMRRRPKYAKPPREEIDENVYLQSWISQAGDHIERYTVGLPATVKETILDGVKREFNARWLVRYDIEDLLGSKEEYQELPGAKGMTITAHPLEWVKDPWKVVSKFSINAWGAVSDFQDYSNEFIWEFSVGPMLQGLGLVEVETVPKDIEIPGLRNPVKVSGRLIPKVDPTNHRPDTLAMALREFARFRSAWPERWSSGLLPSQGVIMYRFAAEVDALKLPKTDPLCQLAEEMRAKVVTYWDDDPRVKAVVSSTLLDAGDSADEIKKRARGGVFNPNRAEADYTNQIGSYYKKMSQTLDRVGNLSPGLEKIRKISTWLNQEELVCLTNDLVQAGLEGKLVQTYAWRLFRGIKLRGRTIQNWIRTPVDFIKTKVPVASHLNKGLAYAIKHPAKDSAGNTIPGRFAGIGPALDRIQTVVLSKLTTAVRKLGLEKVFASVITAGVGAATGGVSIVVGALAKNIAGRILGNILGMAWKEKTKLPLYGCGCLLTIFAAPIVMMWVIMSGFKVPMQRMGIGGAGVQVQLVTITKTVSPTSFPKSSGTGNVSYTVEVTNKSDQEATIVDLKDGARVLDGSAGKTISPSGGKATFPYTGTIPLGEDKAYVNTVTGSATVSGKTIPLTASAVVVVGTPPDLRPAGWPTSGTITQGPGCTYSHGGFAAVDIANDPPPRIHATHGGKVIFSGWGGAYGKTVIVKNAYAQTRYSHLESIEVLKDADVNPGTPLGTMGRTGESTKITGVHLHYEIEQLTGFDGSALSWNARLVNVSGLFYVPETVPNTCENWKNVASSY